MEKLKYKINDTITNTWCKTKCMLKNNDGDQITGWLIVVLLVVVVGAFFLNSYRTTITEIWDAIVDKIYDTFGI